jgi:hypothetical protein
MQGSERGTVPIASSTMFYRRLFACYLLEKHHVIQNGRRGYRPHTQS